MILVGLGFIFLAVARNMEPYELLPIGLGIVAVNMPLTGLTTLPTEATGVQEAGLFGITFHYGLAFWNILPPLMFLGLGAGTDFGPMIANPKTLLLGAAAQIGIFAGVLGRACNGTVHHSRGGLHRHHRRRGRSDEHLHIGQARSRHARHHRGHRLLLRGNRRVYPTPAHEAVHDEGGGGRSR